MTSRVSMIRIFKEFTSSCGLSLGEIDISTVGKALSAPKILRVKIVNKIKALMTNLPKK
jgi:hypothetical protein